MLRSIVRSGLRYQQRWTAVNCAAMSSAAPAPIIKPDIKQTGVRYSDNLCKLRLEQIKIWKNKLSYSVYCQSFYISVTLIVRESKNWIRKFSVLLPTRRLHLKLSNLIYLFAVNENLDRK